MYMLYRRLQCLVWNKLFSLKPRQWWNRKITFKGEVKKEKQINKNGNKRFSYIYNSSFTVILSIDNFFLFFNNKNFEYCTKWYLFVGINIIPVKNFG